MFAHAHKQTETLMTNSRVMLLAKVNSVSQDSRDASRNRTGSVRWGAKIGARRGDRFDSIRFDSNRIESGAPRPGATGAGELARSAGL